MEDILTLWAKPNEFLLLLIIIIAVAVAVAVTDVDCWYDEHSAKTEMNIMLCSFLSSRILCILFEYKCHENA